MSRVNTQLARLTQIASSQSSIYLPNNTSAARLVLNLKTDTKAGHMGLKKFWRQHIPSIKFYNPDVQIEVVRVKCDTLEQHLKVPATLKYIAGEQTVELDCKNKHSDEILKELIEKAGAQVVPEAERVVVGKK